MSVVHFNSAGAGLPAPETVQTIIEHLCCEVEYGPMEAGARVKDRLDKTYQAAARLLGCAPQQVAFGSGHGQLYGDIVSAISLNAEDKILVSRQEWIGNVLCLHRAASLSGAAVSVMASDDSTAVDIAALHKALSKPVRIVALTWVGASGSLINPAAAIGQAIRQSGSSAFFIIDASQAVGQLSVDVSQIGCDALIACGRKFLLGPRGTAIAYISPRLAADIVPRRVDDASAAWIDGEAVVSKSARAFELGEESIALRLGLGSAIERALELGLDNIRAALNAKASALRRSLAAVSGVRLLDLGKEKAACVTFTLDGWSCGAVKQNLADRGITIGTNGPDYTPYDMEMRGIVELLRASVHLSTTEQDIEKLVRAVRELVADTYDEKGLMIEQ